MKWEGYQRRPRGTTALTGPKKRALVQTELKLYPAWEELLWLHRLEYWHCVVPQASQPGWPDYVVMGKGWHAFVELKARSWLTKRVGKLNEGQERYRDALVEGGAEYRVFILPDDWHEVDVWLNSKTGRDIWDRFSNAKPPN